MEMMEVEEGSSVSNSNNGDLLICCLTKKHGLKQSKIPVTDFGSLKLEGLKDVVLQELNSWEWVDDNEKPKVIDILHRSRIMKTDEDLKKIGPLSVVTVIKRGVPPISEEEHNKSAKFIADYAAKHKIDDVRVKSCSISLRTAFLNPKFSTMIEGLKNAEKLETIFAIVPELQNDPVAIGIIQDLTLIFYLSDAKALKKLASTKPWMILAFEFLAASIHQERGIPSHGISRLFNPNMLDGDDEDMEEGDDEGGAAGSSRAPAITREQLAAALSGLGGGGAANALTNIFHPPQPAGTTAPQQSNPNPLQSLMNSLDGALGGAPGQPLNTEAVARAVTDALRRLPPEQRAEQLNSIRNFASQLQESSPNAPVATSPSSTFPSQTQQTPATQPQPSLSTSSMAQQYQAQLQQMREMGITDQRLSILALRVSDGDVNTAVELIFSGWQGEGSDPSS